MRFCSALHRSGLGDHGTDEGRRPRVGEAMQRPRTLPSPILAFRSTGRAQVARRRAKIVASCSPRGWSARLHEPIPGPCLGAAVLRQFEFEVFVFSSEI